MATSRRRTTYQAGDEVDSKCTRCKMVLAHTIVAMAEDRIAKVRCNTCKGEHTYRAPPSASEATAQKRRAAKKSVASEAAKTKSEASEFEGLTRGRDLSRAKKYAVSMALELNSVVDHPTFGIGLVTEIREGNKAHVAFPDGGRILVYGR